MAGRMMLVRFGFEGETDSIFCGQIERAEVLVRLDILLIWKAISLLMLLAFLAGLVFLYWDTLSADCNILDTRLSRGSTLELS